MQLKYVYNKWYQWKKVENNREIVMSKFKFDLGVEVIDQITGFKGFITGRCQYMTGCNTYDILPKIKIGEEGKYPDGRWIDENRIKKTGTRPIKLESSLKSSDYDDDDDDLDVDKDADSTGRIKETGAMDTPPSY